MLGTQFLQTVFTWRFHMAFLHCVFTLGLGEADEEARLATEGPMCLRRLLGAFFDVLGPSWGLLERLGTLLGGSWAIWERLWSDLSTKSMLDPFSDRFWTRKGRQNGALIELGREKGAKREAFGEPKWSQNRSPKRFKIEVDFQGRKNTLQDRLGTVLEPSWADLGPS